VLILAVAAGVRLWGVTHDLPFSFYGDELHFMKRAMAMGTGDLNPHWFHKPSFVLYILLGVYGLFFVFGRAVGMFQSTLQFGAYFLANFGPFLLLGRLVVVAFGILAVYLTYKLAHRLHGSTTGAVAAAAVAALTPGLVSSSHHIKADVPCAALMMASLLAYHVVVERHRARWLTVPGSLAGAALGAHLYAVILLPTFLAAELYRAWRGSIRLREAMIRLVIVSSTFFIGFFLTSPFSVLDASGIAYVNPERDGVNFVVFTPDNPTWYGPFLHFFDVLFSRNAFGPELTVLAVVGLAALVRSKATQFSGILLGIPIITFATIAIAETGYEAEPRHLSAIYPLLAIAAWSGARAITNRLAGADRPRYSLALVLAATIPAAVTTVSLDRDIMRLDSRVAAYRWILQSVPRDARVLLDDYGPLLSPSGDAANRLLRKLAELPEGPFTIPDRRRLELLAEYPPAEGFDVEELGHQWWLGREVSDLDLHQSRFHQDMGNPLISRVPRSLEAYRRAGVRYVITNSLAQSRYRKGYRERDSFPSFARFYDRLHDEVPMVRKFDPAEWRGKGPIIEVYDLQLPTLTH
jgi:hypothetical protein